MFNPNPSGEGQICPAVSQTLIPLEPNVGLTVNSGQNGTEYKSRGQNRDLQKQSLLTYHGLS